MLLITVFNCEGKNLPADIWYISYWGYNYHVLSPSIFVKPFTYFYFILLVLSVHILFSEVKIHILDHTLFLHSSYIQGLTQDIFACSLCQFFSWTIRSVCKAMPFFHCTLIIRE